MARSDLPPDAVPIGKITPRRLSADELEAIKLAETPAAPHAPPPAELKVAARMRETRRLSEERFRQTEAFAHRRGVSEGDALIALNFATEDDVIATEAELTSTRWLPGAQLVTQAVPADVVALVPQALCVELQVSPLGRDPEGRLLMAMRDPYDATALARLSGLTLGARLLAVRVGSRALEALLRRLHCPVVDDDPSTWLER